MRAVGVAIGILFAAFLAGMIVSWLLGVLDSTGHWFTIGALVGMLVGFATGLSWENYRLRHPGSM